MSTKVGKFFRKYPIINGLHLAIISSTDEVGKGWRMAWNKESLILESTNLIPKHRVTAFLKGEDVRYEIEGYGTGEFNLKEVIKPYLLSKTNKDVEGRTNFDIYKLFVKEIRKGVENVCKL